MDRIISWLVRRICELESQLELWGNPKCHIRKNGNTQHGFLGLLFLLQKIYDLFHSEDSHNKF